MSLLTASWIPLLLVVAASLCWSGLDWARKAMSAHAGPIPFLIVLTFGQALVLLPWIMSMGGAFSAESGYWVPGLTSLSFNILANWLFMRAVTIAPLSLTVPYLALTPMFTALLAIPMLGEWPSLPQSAGIVLTVAGALTLNPDAANGLKAMLTSFTRERGSAYMATVALLWSLASPLDKLAMQHASVTFHSFVLCVGLPLVFLLILAGQRKLAALAQPFRRPGVLALAVGFGVGALVMQLTAMQAVYVGLVEAIKRVIGLAMAALVGRLFFQEPLTRQKLVALGLMAVGVSLILFPTRP